MMFTAAMNVSSAQIWVPKYHFNLKELGLLKKWLTSGLREGKYKKSRETLMPKRKWFKNGSTR